MTDNRPLATRAEIAQWLGISKGTLEQWAHRRIGPPYLRVGSLAKYRWSDVEAWVDERAVGV